MARAKAPLIAFVALLVVGCTWLVAVPGRATWAATDDWRMVGTHSWSIEGLLSDHNQHFSLIPILAYKALFAAFGFNPFWPYVLITVLLHACVVILARSIMIRCAVTPWIATMCASALIVVQGASVVVSQFQMGLGLSLALTAFIIAMNPTGKALTAVGAVSAVAAVASSGIALPIIAAAFVTAWRRRSPAAATVLTAPAAVVYAAWYLLYSPGTPVIFRQPLSDWFPHALLSALLGLGGLPVTTAVLLLATMAGIGLALVRRGTRVRWLEPAVLVVSALVMLLLAYTGRGYVTPAGIGFERFVYLVAVQALPLIAVAATVLTRRHAWLLVVFLGPLAVGAVVNVHGWQQWASYTFEQNAVQKASLAALLASPYGEATPDWVQPYGTAPYFVAGNGSWGFLRTVTAQRAGVDDVAVTGATADAAVLRLRLAKVLGTAEPSSRCVTGSEPVLRVVSPGDRVVVPSALAPNTAVTASLVRKGQIQPGSVLVEPGVEGMTLQALGTRRHVAFQAADSGATFTVCF